MEEIKKELKIFLSSLTKWQKFHIAYFLVTIIIFLISLVVEYLLFQNWQERVIAYIFTIAVSAAMLVFMEGFFGLFPRELRKRWGQKVFIWKNDEFDDFVGDDLIELYRESYKLLELSKRFCHHNLSVTDYSYVVLPAAKAYEGILKKILVNAGLISESQLLENPEMSINNYFNPVGNQTIFASLKDKARDKAVPHIIYSTYQECRNKILHYDSYRDNRLILEDAEFYIRRIDDAIEKAYATFRPKHQIQQRAIQDL